MTIRKLYIKSFILIILTVLLVKLLDSYIIQDEEFHIAYNKFINKNEKYDFVYMGNSLSQRSYNVDYIDSLLNTKSINIGGSAHHFSLTNALFQKLINNKELYPNKLLVIEISPWQFEKYKTEKLIFLQTPIFDELQFSKEYYQLLQEFRQPKEYPEMLSSTIRFHNNLIENFVETNTKLKSLKKSNYNGFSLKVEKQIDQNLRDIRMGFFEIAAQYPEMVDSSIAIELNTTTEAMVIDIIEKCKEKEIPLLFVTAPAINQIWEKEHYGKMKYIEDLLTKNKAHHINFNRYFIELGLTFDDYTDYSHVNVTGTRKIAPVLLKYITYKLNISKNIQHEIIKTKKIFNLLKVNDLLNKEAKITETEDYYNKEKIYLLSRTSTSESSFINTKSIKTIIDNRYTTSVVVKKGEKSNLFGLRIQGVYPDRIDAVFNLNDGTIKDKIATGGFKNENASITFLGDGWYKCSVSALINSTKIKIIFGPTTAERKIKAWEGKTNSLVDTYIIPTSLLFKKTGQ